MKKSHLTQYIFIALILGVLVGKYIPSIAVELKPLSDIFLRMIKMIIAPLIFSTLVIGIAGHGSMKNLGKLGIKTVVYFEIVTTLALLIGLGFANYFKPGIGVHIDLTKIDSTAMTQIQDAAMNQTHHFSDTFVHMVPESVVDAMATGNILQVVFFAVFFALAIGAIGDKAKPIIRGLHSLSDIMFKFTEYVMFFAPLGVFSAIAYTIGSSGTSILGGYMKLIGTVYGALITFVIVVLIVACSIVKIPFFSLIKAIKDPALLAFTTASSEAALPKAMDIMERFGVPKKIVSFVMPTGYTFNLDGSTLYLSLATLFIAQLAGRHLPISEQLTIMFTLMLASKGIAAVPRVSLVILTGTLLTHGLPIAGVAVIAGIDQILDMGRTTVNLIGNCVATTVIARWENDFDYEKMQEYIKNEATPEIEETKTIDIQATQGETI